MGVSESPHTPFGPGSEAPTVEPYELVFAAVILGRFLVPLIIPVYPLPDILCALFLDASDRVISAQSVQTDVEAYKP